MILEVKMLTRNIGNPVKDSGFHKVVAIIVMIVKLPGGGGFK